MYRLVQIVSADKKRHRLHVVIESGHKNVRDTIRIFDELKAEFSNLGFDILGDITIAKKAECWPLMVADFQAHASHLSEMQLRVGLPGYFEMATEIHGNAAPPRNQAALTRIEHTAESLRGLKTTWEAEKQARVDKWRAARDARRASQAISGAAPASGQPA
jgi:hypothetical protein